MKLRMVIVLLGCICGAYGLSWAQFDGTAQACVQHFEEYEGEEITLMVSGFGSSVVDLERFPKWMAIPAHTVDTKENVSGGTIMVLLRKKDADRLLRRTASPLSMQKPLKLKGVLSKLVKEDGNYFAYLNCTKERIADKEDEEALLSLFSKANRTDKGGTDKLKPPRIKISKGGITIGGGARVNLQGLTGK